MKKNETEKQEAIKSLKRLLKPGDTIYTILRHVSTSGCMLWAIDLYIYRRNKYTKKIAPVYLSGYVAKAIDRKCNVKHGGIEIGGCGWMDRGFALVYSLGRTLWPNGDGKTITNRNGDTKPETDGGHLLKQSWQ